MAAGSMDLIIILAVLAVGYYVLSSGILNNLTQPSQAVTTPVTDTGTDTTTTPTTDTTGTTPTTGTDTSTTTTDPLQQLINFLSGGGGSGSNVIPTQQPLPTTQPAQQQPYYGGNAAECQNKYHGKCNTECSSGNTSLCQACQLACGGAQIGVVQTGGGGGGSSAECQSKYHGKCNTECSGGNSSTCQACQRACGSGYAKAYYIQTPQSLMASSVFRNANYSRGVSITNAR